MHKLIVLIALATLPVLTTVVRAEDITVDASRQYQTIEGFGTCLVAWVGEMRELYRTEEFQRIYTEKVGCNMLRVNMWGPVGDVDASDEWKEDWRNISWKDFNIDANGGRGKIFIEFARGIKKINPDVRIIGTVWSPPAWMKMNESITGPNSPSIRSTGYERRGKVATNRVDPEYYAHFAKWMVEYMKMHKQAGVPFYAVSPGNEVQFSQSFESCVWSGEDYAKIVGMLGRLKEAEGFGDVKMFGPETMTSHFYRGGTPQYFEAIMADERAKKYFDVAATHGYEDGFKAEMKASSSARLWKFISQWDLPLWMTEGGTGGHKWPEPLNEGVASAIHNSLVAGHCSAFVPWQIVSRGDANTHALMPRQGPTSKTYAAMHYFKFIPQDSVRIDASPGFGDVKASAYVDPKTRRLSIVLLNPSEDKQPVRLALKNIPAPRAFDVYRTSANENLERQEQARVNNEMTALEMPAESMVTLTGITPAQ
mgnify:FL=1